MYEDFEIRAVPLQLGAPIRWSIDIDIVWHDKDGAHESHCSAAETLATREAVVQNWFEYGRRVIDGRVPGVERPQRH